MHLCSRKAKNTSSTMYTIFFGTETTGLSATDRHVDVGRAHPFLAALGDDGKWHCFLGTPYERCKVLELPVAPKNEKRTPRTFLQLDPTSSSLNRAHLSELGVPRDVWRALVLEKADGGSLTLLDNYIKVARATVRGVEDDPNVYLLTAQSVTQVLRLFPHL